MKSLIVAAALALVAAGGAGAISVAFAQDNDDTDGGPFGDHMTQMTPEHAKAHGAMFGEGVSMMARGEACPHAQ